VGQASWLRWVGAADGAGITAFRGLKSPEAAPLLNLVVRPWVVEVVMAQDLVTVATFATAMDAHLRKNLLEGEGVEAFVADELTGDQLSGAYVHSYVKLQVAQQDEERAQQIFQARERDKGRA